MSEASVHAPPPQRSSAALAHFVPEEVCRLLGREPLVRAAVTAALEERTLAICVDGLPGTGRATWLRAVLHSLQSRIPVVVAELCPESLRGRDRRALAAELYRRVSGPMLVHTDSGNGTVDPESPIRLAHAPMPPAAGRTALLLEGLESLDAEGMGAVLHGIGSLHSVPRLLILASLDSTRMPGTVFGEGPCAEHRGLLDRAFHLRLRLPVPGNGETAFFVNEWLRRAGIPCSVTPEEAGEAFRIAGNLLGLERRLHAYRFLRTLARSEGLLPFEFDAFFWGRGGCGTGAAAFQRLMRLVPHSPGDPGEEEGVPALDEEEVNPLGIEFDLSDPGTGAVRETGFDLGAPEPEYGDGAIAACVPREEPEDPDTDPGCAVEAAFEGLEPLLFRANSPEPGVRKDAALGLGRQRDAKGLATLVHLLGDPCPSVRVAAVQAISELGESAAVPHVIPLLASRDADTRRAAAAGLGRLGDTAAVHDLRVLLDDDCAEVRRSAAAALGAIGGADAVGVLLRSQSDADAVTRRAVISALETLGSRVGVVPFLEALRDASVEVRRGAARILADTAMPGEGALEVLQAAIRDEDAQVRRFAVCALARCAGEGGTDALLAALRDPDDEVRNLAREKVERLEGGGLVQVLVRRLGDPVRAGLAEELLHRLDGSSGTHALLAALHDPSAEVRGRAVTLLSDRRSDEVREALRAHHDREWEPEVRRLVAVALVRLGVDGAERPRRGRAL